MKVIQHSPFTRVIARHVKQWHDDIIEIRVQRRVKCWYGSKWQEMFAFSIDIELNEFWVVPGQFIGDGMDRTKIPLRHGMSYGCDRETWYPQHFDIEKRMRQLLNEYIGSMPGKLKAEAILKGLTA